MADPRDKVSENVAGRYYVDAQCIDCDVCRTTARSNFERQEEKGYSYVFRQPRNAEEEAQCEEAMDCCPVEAIGVEAADTSAADAQLRTEPSRIPAAGRGGAEG